MSAQTATDYDVLIAGGGPGGAICAAHLAMLGRRVLVLEKEHFPRFHLGESLLPQSMPILRAVGVLEQVEARFMVKRGANFHESSTGKTSRYAFDDAFDKRVGSAFQVPRDEFDQLLLAHAQSLGAEAREGCTVTRAFHDDATGVHGFEVRDESDTVSRISARFVVDATGRDALFAHAARLTHKVPKLDQTALYSHFEGCYRDEGEREGDIQIVVFNPGWFWFIPFKDGRTSVGAVVNADWMRARARMNSSGRDLEALFWSAVEESPVASRFLAGAKQNWLCAPPPTSATA